MRLYSDRFGVIKIAIPPISEQTAILKHLNNATIDLNREIARSNSEIGIINEYRSRLIADVVTGKLDVRAAAATLPEPSKEPEELEAADLAEDEAEETDEMESEEEAA